MPFSNYAGIVWTHVVLEAYDKDRLTWSWQTTSFPGCPWATNAKNFTFLPSRTRSALCNIDSSVSSFLYCRAVMPKTNRNSIRTLNKAFNFLVHHIQTKITASANHIQQYSVSARALGLFSAPSVNPEADVCIHVQWPNKFSSNCWKRFNIPTEHHWTAFYKCWAMCSTMLRAF